jgi:hypothetical protein
MCFMCCNVFLTTNMLFSCARRKYSFSWPRKKAGAGPKPSFLSGIPVPGTATMMHLYCIASHRILVRTLASSLGRNPSPIESARVVSSYARQFLSDEYKVSYDTIYDS